MNADWPATVNGRSPATCAPGAKSLVASTTLASCGAGALTLCAADELPTQHAPSSPAAAAAKRRPLNIPTPLFLRALGRSLDELDDLHSEVGAAATGRRHDPLGEEPGEVPGQAPARAVRRLRVDVEGDPADDVELRIRAAQDDRRLVDREQHLVADPGAERVLEVRAVVLVRG